MSKERVHIISKINMDGAGCVTILKHILNNAVITHEGVLDKNLYDLLEKHNTKGVTYDKLFICGLPLEPDSIRLIDSKHTFIVNNIVDDNIKGLKTKCKLFLEECDSTTELIYRKFSNSSSVEFSKQQKVLIRLISDFESYKLTTPFSYALNIVYYSFTGDRIKQFSNTFKDGFNGFNPQQQASLLYHNRRVEDVLRNLEPYSASVKLEGKDYNILSAFCDYGVNEVSKYFFDKLNADISIVINLEKNYVSFRANDKCDYDVSKLAAKLCNGGGKTKTAGGTLTEKILTFSKLFKSYES